MPKPKKKPLISEPSEASITLRPQVREAMRAAKRPLSVPALLGLIRRIDPGASEVDVADALEWNFKSGFADFEFNRELQVRLYTLTRAGLKA